MIFVFILPSKVKKPKEHFSTRNLKISFKPFSEETETRKTVKTTKFAKALVSVKTRLK